MRQIIPLFLICFKNKGGGGGFDAQQGSLREISIIFYFILGKQFLHKLVVTLWGLSSPNKYHYAQFR